MTEPQKMGRLQKVTAIEYFWKRAVTSPDCWQWAGTISDKGYGILSLASELHPRRCRAARFAYSYFIGPIPEGMVIDHLCRNRGCVNPFHLEAISNKENIMRGICPSSINAKKTQCYRGHPYSPQTLKVFRDGFRRCFECIKLEPSYLKRNKNTIGLIAREH